MIPQLFMIASVLAAPPVSSQPAGRVVQFAEGVRIDWGRKQVEVDSEVVLREGLLELLACSKGTKEHESILRIRARPLHVYQALGMLGVEDGQPSRFDEATRTVSPPRGTAVEVMIRLTRDVREATEDAASWLMPRDSTKKMPAARWYFVAAAPAKGERFGADIYGTVATLMPFGTSIVLLAPAGSIQSPTSQPAALKGVVPDDSEYANTPQDWELVPDPKRVPAIGTRVTLIIRPTARGLGVRIDRFGRYWLEDREASLDDVEAAMRSAGHGTRAFVEVEPCAVENDVSEAVAALVRGGAERSAIDIRRPANDAILPGDRGAAFELLRRAGPSSSVWRELSSEFSRINEDLRRRREELERLAAAIREALDRRAATTGKAK